MNEEVTTHLTEGIDVSRYQNPNAIDWVELAKHVQFVYVKATDGVGSPDPRFEEHRKRAVAVGLCVGAYHYLRVRTGKQQDAVKQADEFCDVILSHRDEFALLPALDIESDGNKTASGAEIREAVELFLGRCEQRLGKKIWLYTYPSFWASYTELTKNDALSQHPLWIAHYTTAPEPIVPKPWKSWSMWQFAAGVGVIGRVPGVPFVVDRNKLRVSLDELKLFPQAVAKSEVPEQSQSEQELVVPELTPTVDPVTDAPEPPRGVLQVLLGFLSLIVEFIRGKRP